MVINVKNPNALIAMAFVSQNAGNPYLVFCEYIKYCIFVNAVDSMTLTEIRDAVASEFGLYIPYNIAVKCLSIIEEEGMITQVHHQIKRVGVFDTEAFDRERGIYKETENSLIDALIKFVAKYDREWSYEYAREQLIKVLDKNGLAYDIFIHGKSVGGNGAKTTVSQEEINELLPDEEAVECEDIEKQPMYSDSFYVGRFIEQTLLTDSIQKDYLQRICEGLMLCVGAYQLPSADVEATMPQIKNTRFFFDTRLLLRFVGCAGEAAVEAAKELVGLIQSRGGSISYYPQTLEEMNRAFDEAIRNLSHGYPPRDNEMRMYAAQIKNNTSVLRSKKANLEKELSSAKIYMRQHENFTDAERIHFGFERSDLQQYMEENLKWDSRTIENDAYSLWETHMHRRGDYSEYCGTQAQLPVFVTTNSRLIGIAIGYREARSSINGIYGWKPNRLPVITDIKLTCRLWVPTEQSERLSLLYLTANAVAAQRPTRRYLNTVRELAIELEKAVPEYSGIPLPSYFEDNVTDVLLEHTLGAEEKFNLGTFASSLAELSEWKANEQEKITKQVTAERDKAYSEFDQQTQDIIEGAMEENKSKFGLIEIVLRLILWWPAIVTLLFAGFSALVAYATGNWHVLWVVIIPMIMSGVEMFSSSMFIKKLLLKWLFPKLEIAFNKRITKNLRKAEMPYRDIIIQRVKEETILWAECAKILKD